MANHEYIKLKLLNYLLHHDDFYGADYEHMPLWISEGVVVRNHKLADNYRPTFDNEIVVVTRYAKQLSWLFYLLKLVCLKKIAIIGEKEFYLILANQANEYSDLNEGTPGFSPKVFIDYMLSCVETLYEEVDDEEIDYDKIIKMIILKYNRQDFMGNTIAINNRNELLNKIDALDF